MTERVFKAVWKAVLITALIAVAPSYVPSRGTDPEAVRLQSGNTVFYDHREECWNGATPAKAEIPTHSIIRKDADSPWVYAGPTWTKAALEHVFDDANPDMYVYAFCE